MKYEVNAGERFDVANAEIIRARRDYEETTVRGWVTLLVIGAGVTYLLGATVLGLTEGNFEKLETSWGVLSVPLSAILTYYYAGTRS
jgi:hypothetical protein